MRIKLVPPGDDLISSLASVLRPVGRDYSRWWIVFPERRPGHYVRKALAESEGSSFIPPVLDSWEGFVDRLYGERLGLHDRLVEPLDAVAILFDIHRDLPNRLGREAFLSADAFFPLGIKIFHDLEEVSLAGAKADGLRGIENLTGEAVQSGSLGQLQSLARFHEQFYERLGQGGYSSPASRLGTVVARLRPEHLGGFEDILFAGVYPLAKLERTLLRRILDWDRGSLVLSRVGRWERILEMLDVPRDSWPVPPAGEPAARPNIEFVKCPDTHGQVFALNKAFESELKAADRLHEKQAVILCAAETLFPLYQQTLSKLPEGSYNISLGYPLLRTPLYGFFEKLLELVQTRDEAGRVYAPHYLRFVLHPYAKNLLFPGPERRTDLTRVLFHAVEEALTGRRMKAFWDLEELEKDEAVRQTVQDRVLTLDDAPEVNVFLDHLRSVHDRTIRPFGRIRDVGDFAGKLVGVLETVYRHGTARLHPFFHPYAEAAFHLLDKLRRSRFQETAFQDIGGYVQLFRKVFQAGSVPFLGMPLGGLQVLGFWEARGLPLEEVSLLDVNEGIIPSFSRTDSLLPYAVVRALSIPTVEDLEGRMTYCLQALIGRARRLRVFFVENSEKERSRYVEQLVWEGQKREGRPGPEEDLRTVSYKVALKPDRPSSVDRTPEVEEMLGEFSFSASALDLYLRCPLRFYYRYVLGIREAEEVAPRMEKKHIGTFVHGVLEEFFRPCVGRPMVPSDMNPARLGGVIERTFERDFGGDDAGSAFLLKKQAERHLGAFLERYQLPLLTRLRAEGKDLVISSLESDWRVEREFFGRSFRLAARTDRVELRGGDLFVLDYKTGAREKYLNVNFGKLDPERPASWPEAVGSLQLPLYGIILSRVTGRPAALVRGGCLMLGRNVIDERIEFFPYDQEDAGIRDQQALAMETVIGRLLEEVCRGAKHFEPRGHTLGLCPDCAYRTMCR